MFEESVNDKDGCFSLQLLLFKRALGPTCLIEVVCMMNMHEYMASLSGSRFDV